ncbi:MAG TPA: sigma-70 family RNA polymerase sigma factor [Bryobacteraceae bacterium]|nr:sigma-70 family RNA polymerase sigma factor [Bryobacteraceae bacterium]
MDQQPITGMLQRFADGDKQALDQLMPLVYAELQRLASGYLRGERPGHTLQPTALVHEAYARLLKQEQPDYRNRAHFLGTAAQLMRQILIDHARTRNAAKRGGGSLRLHLDGQKIAIERAPFLLAVDDALTALARKDPLKARLVEMRFFGGLTAEESAEAIGKPVTEVRRDLRVALAWLQRELDRAETVKGAGA